MIAPDFTLKDQYGVDYNLYENLNSFVMLVFYPRDESHVCTKQLCNYNDNFSEFEQADIKIVGINIDNQQSHKSFADKYLFKYPILSDTDKVVSRAYDALNYAGHNKRKVVIISNKREIVYQETVFPLFYQKSNEILKFLRTNKYI